MDKSTEHNRYLPWRRAESLIGSALYWIPVSAFPCRAAEKHWLRQFLLAFDQEMKNALRCRVEIFVHRDAIYPDSVEPLLMNVLELNPIPGVMRMYGEPLRKAPKPREIVKIVKDGKADTLLSLGTDTGWWFAKKKADAQRDLFLGLGGMVNVWLPPDPKTAPPAFHLSEKALKHPAFAAMDVEGSLQVTYSLADSFLPNSLATFGPELKSDPQYRGYPFALTLFKSQDILAARGEQRQEWLRLAPCYMFESRSDSGLLLWGAMEIDAVLTKTLEILRQQKMEYPTV